MKFVSAAILVLFGAGAYAAVDTLYKVSPVTSYEDAIKCGEKGGRGAFVFDLDKEGNVVSEQAPFCIEANQ